ncbi:MAG: aspartate/glutamate racemase family protein [Christensenellales bacterium]
MDRNIGWSLCAGQPKGIGGVPGATCFSLSETKCLIRHYRLSFDSGDGHMYKLGILGGMGPFATADTLARVVKFTFAKADQEHIPTIILSDPRVPDRSDFICGQGTDPMPKLLEGIRTLEKFAVEAIIIPCNSAHYFVPQLQAVTPIPIIDMVKETVNYIASSLLTKHIMVFGTVGLLKSNVYQNRFAQNNLAIESSSEADQMAVMSVIREIKKTGEYQQSRKNFEELIARVNRQNDCCFVFACTELSLIKHHYNHLQVVDPLDVLVVTAIQKLGFPIDYEELIKDDAKYQGKLAEYFAVGT